MMGKDADVFLSRLTRKLSKKWDRPCSRTISFAHTQFAISLVRAKSRHLRGSHIVADAALRRVDWEDGAGLSLCSTLEQHNKLPMTIKAITSDEISFAALPFFASSFPLRMSAPSFKHQSAPHQCVLTNAHSILVFSFANLFELAHLLS